MGEFFCQCQGLNPGFKSKLSALPLSYISFHPWKLKLYLGSTSEFHWVSGSPSAIKRMVSILSYWEGSYNDLWDNEQQEDIIISLIIKWYPISSKFKEK